MSDDVLKRFAAMFYNRHLRWAGTRVELTDVATEMGLSSPPMPFDRTTRLPGHGRYEIPLDAIPVEESEIKAFMEAHLVSNEAMDINKPPSLLDKLKTAAGVVQPVNTASSLVPDVDPMYVPWGHYHSIKKIIESGIFFPTYIVGETGNGKTTMVEQACAHLGRELIVAAITSETDEDSLLGGFRLVNGETVFQHGPVALAMQRGAVLLLDELDLATPKVMCLQGVLNAGRTMVKRTNEVIRAVPGFQVFATGNTKGKGSLDGRYIGTNSVNEAFLDRLPLTYDQPYPPAEVELQILKRVAEKHLATMFPNGEIDKTVTTKVANFLKKLVSWAGNIRGSFASGNISDTISPRRLISIVTSYMIFDLNSSIAIDLGVSRFDDDTQGALLTFYRAVDPDYDEDKRMAEARASINRS